MTSASPSGSRSAPGAQHQPWLKFAALVLVVAALGLPVNDLFRYGLLVIAAVIIVAGTISRRRTRWLGALAAVVLCVLAQVWLAAPRIEEGHNVFLVDGAGGALEDVAAVRGLSVHGRGVRRQVSAGATLRPRAGGLLARPGVSAASSSRFPPTASTTARLLRGA